MGLFAGRSDPPKQELKSHRKQSLTFYHYLTYR
jgi:hypothetical protein